MADPKREAQQSNELIFCGKAVELISVMTSAVLSRVKQYTHHHSFCSFPVASVSTHQMTAFLLLWVEPPQADHPLR
jgi:hypothetical protein